MHVNLFEITLNMVWLRYEKKTNTNEYCKDIWGNIIKHFEFDFVFYLWNSITIFCSKRKEIQKYKDKTNHYPQKFKLRMQKLTFSLFQSPV